MNSSVLGIDFGTSSVKVLQKFRDNSVKKYKKEYKRKDRKGWWDAILSIFDEINFENVVTIGLASQVGTYLVNDKEIIHWNQAEGKEELLLQTNLIAGSYLKNHLHYGVTACGGDSIKMAPKLKTNRKVEKEEFLQKAPEWILEEICGLKKEDKISKNIMK